MVLVIFDMKKVNCYRCDYVCRPSHMPMANCDTEDLLCAHPCYDGAAPIDAVTDCPKTFKRFLRCASRKKIP